MPSSSSPRVGAVICGLDARRLGPELEAPLAPAEQPEQRLLAFDRTGRGVDDVTRRAGARGRARCGPRSCGGATRWCRAAVQVEELEQIDERNLRQATLDHLARLVHHRIEAPIHASPARRTRSPTSSGSASPGSAAAPHSSAPPAGVVADEDEAHAPRAGIRAQDLDQLAGVDQLERARHDQHVGRLADRGLERRSAVRNDARRVAAHARTPRAGARRVPGWRPRSRPGDSRVLRQRVMGTPSARWSWKARCSTVTRSAVWNSTARRSRSVGLADQRVARSLGVVHQEGSARADLRRRHAGHRGTGERLGALVGDEHQLRCGSGTGRSAPVPRAPGARTERPARRTADPRSWERRSTSPSTKRSTCGSASRTERLPLRGECVEHQRERLAFQLVDDALAILGEARRQHASQLFDLGAVDRIAKPPPGACAAARLRRCRAPRRASTVRASGASARRRRARRSRASTPRSAPRWRSRAGRWCAARGRSGTRSARATRRARRRSARGASAQSPRAPLRSARTNARSDPPCGSRCAPRPRRRRRCRRASRGRGTSGARALRKRSAFARATAAGAAKRSATARSRSSNGEPAILSVRRTKPSTRPS